MLNLSGIFFTSEGVDKKVDQWGEMALSNISTLRTQTCFRLSDGNFFAYEGCNNRSGYCWGSCTHVWNY